MAIDIIARGMIEDSNGYISQLFNITKGGETVSGESSYTISNAVDYPLLGLNLFGKSVQDGTPSPDAPVDIVSVGDNGFDIITKDDKHFNLLSVRDSGGDIITKQPVSTVVKIGEKATFTVAASGTGLKYQWQWSADGGKTWKNTSTTTASYSIPASASSYNGYKYRCVITYSSGKSVISDEATLYVLADDCEVKTASIATDALPLCGIPVSSGGNYTDSNGQQWIADELIYNADGTGKIVKHTAKYTFTGNENFDLRKNDNGRCVYALANFLQYKFYSESRIISDKFVCADTVASGATAINSLKIGETCLFFNNTSHDNAIYFGSSCTTLADFKSEISGSTIIYPLASPYEIELTASEMTALKVLQTFDGITNIFNNGGADMDVKFCTNKALSEYVLPITKGLQAQIDELRAAVLSLGGNV